MDIGANLNTYVTKYGIFKYIYSIPYGSRIALYGKNTVGKSAFKLISKFRKDVQIAFFIDSFDPRDCFGVPCYLVPDAALKSDEYDYLLVTHIDKLNEISENLQKLPEDKIVISALSALEYSNGFEINKIEDFYEKIALVTSRLGGKSQKAWEALLSAMTNYSLFPLIEGIGSFVTPMNNYLNMNHSFENAFMIDGGVFDGEDSTRYLEVCGPEGRVYAFEPLGDQHFSSSFNNALSKDSRLKLVPKGMWNTSGELYFHVAGTMSHVTETPSAKSDACITIPVTTIDDFVDQEGIDQLDFIKMDIEGAELNALKGAEKTISRLNPVLAICIYHGFDQYINIPYYLMTKYPNYHFEIGIHDINGSEIVIYATPNQ